ncbi:MAG: protein kinase domain-containing protein [Myxococcota bacterium]
MTKFCPECETRYEQAGLDHCPEDGTRLRVLVEDVDLDGDLIGRVLEGRWQIRERLGQGGMGTVFLATQQTVDRKVAVKMLKPALTSSKDYAERFMREANVATSLNNPHCVTVYDFGQTHDGLLYLAMELLEGRALADVLRDQHLCLRDVLTVASQICSALAAAHAGKIVHRDLKPDNVFLVDVPGGGVFSKVLDFGIAKIIDNTDETPVTETGQIFGTPAYMSPEQCHSSDVDQRSDLYSLGVILYELVSGGPPFYHSTPIKTLMAHINSAVQPPSEIGVPIPDEFERIILTLLEKEAEDRYATALDVRRDVEKLMRELTDEQLAEIPALGGVSPDGETIEVVEDPDAQVETSEAASDPEPATTLEPAELEEAPQTGWSTGLVVMVAMGAVVATAAVILWTSGKDGANTQAGTRTALEPNAVAKNDSTVPEERAELQEPSVALDENRPNAIDRETQPSIGAEGETAPEQTEPEAAASEDEEDRKPRARVEKTESKEVEPRAAPEAEPEPEAEKPAQKDEQAEKGDKKDAESPAMLGDILTSESASRIIKSHYPEIRRCYQKGLVEDADFGGEIKIKMVVSDTGSVVNSKIVSSEVDHEGVETCITEAAKTWSFPEPADGFYKTLNHSFMFGSK